MATNRVSAEISAADVKAVSEAISTIKKKLPFLIDLSPAERSALPKMGDKSQAFVKSALEIATQNEDILPRKFDIAEFKKDVALLEQLLPLSLQLNQLAELLDDTMLATGSEAYSAALVVYQQAKLAGKGGGMDKQLDALGKRFARKLKGTEDKKG